MLGIHELIHDLSWPRPHLLLPRSTPTAPKSNPLPHPHAAFSPDHTNHCYSPPSFPGKDIGMEETWGQSSENRLLGPLASPSPPPPLHFPAPWLPHRGQGGLGGQSRIRAGLAAAGKLECFPNLLAKHHVGEEDEGALNGRRQQLSQCLFGHPRVSMDLPQAGARPGTWMQLQAAKR